MFRPVLRATTAATPYVRTVAQKQAGKRFASTASKSSGSWRGAAARWGLAGGLVYYYNTSSIFAEEPQYILHAPPETAHESETYSTVDSVAEQRRAQARAQLQSSTTQTDPPAATVLPDGENTAPSDPGALEEEASQQGAFNEETGEINWDCPCLGGMAYGPCGEQFRAAFSCFVFSKEDPKGVDCIEHFKKMQDCFREHPEIYGSELDEDEELQPLEGQEGQPAPVPAQPQAASVDGPASRETEKASVATDAVPKPWHDSREGAATQ